eukprot:SAG31_NODE_12090_length_969_cov_1.237931_1_plen_154_part_00
MGWRYSQASFSRVPDRCAATGWEVAAAGGGQPCDGCPTDGESGCWDGGWTWHGWPGVTKCDDQGRVERLWLDSPNGRCDGLVGTLSPCLASLRGLRALSLYYDGDGLAGEVPADLGGGEEGLWELQLSGTAVDSSGCNSYCAAHPRTSMCFCP